MHRLSTKVVPVLAVMLLLVGSVIAQVTTGVIVGNISDQTGAVLGGASVTAKNRGTGIAKTVTTTDKGEFEIGPLTPGDYEVTVEASGFTKTIEESITVNIGSRVTFNVALNPAGAEDVVTVSGEAGEPLKRPTL